MLDFTLSIFSSMFQMNMRDHHDMPFAMPLLMAIVFGGLIGFLVVKYVFKDQPEIEQIKIDSAR